MGFDTEELGNRFMALELLVIQYFRGLANEQENRANLERLKTQTTAVLSGDAGRRAAWIELMESILRPASTQTKQ